jgi:hypothetical protein
MEHILMAQTKKVMQYMKYLVKTVIMEDIHLEEQVLLG